MGTPERPYKNLEEFRLKRSRCRDHKWPCLGCNGHGSIVIPVRGVSTCQTCNGSGKGTKKEIVKAYHKEIQAWKEEVKAWKEEVEIRKEALAKLMDHEIRALRKLGV